MADLETVASHDLLAWIGRVTVAAWAEYTTRSGGRVVTDGGLTYLVGSHPTPIIINTVFRIDPAVPPADVLARSRAFYRSIGHEFTMLTSDQSDQDLNDAAEDAGWQMAVKLPVMVCRSVLPGLPLPTGVSIRRADPVGDIASFRMVVRDGFAREDAEIAAAETVFASSAALDAPDTAGLIASIDGRDVAAALVNVIDGMGYVGWVGTVPEYRRRGLGDAVSRAATNAAFELGARIVALEASPMGLPIYAKMGYEIVATDRIWLPPAG